MVGVDLYPKPEFVTLIATTCPAPFSTAVAAATSVGAGSLELAVIITVGGELYPDPVSTMTIEPTANK
jgi:hypothetical protein